MLHMLLVSINMHTHTSMYIYIYVYIYIHKHTYTHVVHRACFTLPQVIAGLSAAWCVNYFIHVHPLLEAIGHGHPERGEAYCQ